MLKITLLFLVLMVAFHTGQAQDTPLEMINSQPIDQERYEGIDGSPYLFKKWRKARILNEDLKFIDNVMVNYNGNTQEFEVTDGLSYIQLDERAHERVEVWDKEIDAYRIFIKAYSYGLDVPFAQMHFGGKRISWLSTFNVKIDERTLETPGKTEHIKKFVAIQSNYFIIDGSAIEFKMKKKRILSALKSFGSSSSIVGEKGLNIEKEDELIQLLKALDEENSK